MSYVLITAYDNGAYVETLNTNKLYCETGGNVHTVHMDDNQYFDNIATQTYMQDRMYQSMTE